MERCDRAKKDKDELYLHSGRHSRGELRQRHLCPFGGHAVVPGGRAGCVAVSFPFLLFLLCLLLFVPCSGVPFYKPIRHRIDKQCSQLFYSEYSVHTVAGQRGSGELVSSRSWGNSRDGMSVFAVYNARSSMPRFYGLGNSSVWKVASRFNVRFTRKTRLGNQSWKTAHWSSLSQRHGTQYNGSCCARSRRWPVTECWGHFVHLHLSRRVQKWAFLLAGLDAYAVFGLNRISEAPYTLIVSSCGGLSDAVAISAHFYGWSLWHMHSAESVHVVRIDALIFMIMSFRRLPSVVGRKRCGYSQIQWHVYNVRKNGVIYGVIVSVRCHQSLS